LLHAADLPVFAVGFVASFVAAMLTVKALLRYVSNHDFTVFAWYRIAFGILVLVTAQAGWVEWAA
jgi:undecaprenyl-diphosphatase